MLITLAHIFATETLALIAAISALGALFVALWDAHRNHSVVIRLAHISGGLAADVHGKHAILTVMIRNCGIQMQNVSMTLGFRTQNGDGHLQIPIPLRNQSRQGIPIFLRGTTAKFELSIREPRSHEQQLLALLVNARVQRPTILIYNDGFLAKSIPMFRKLDSMKRIWNKAAHALCIHRKVGKNDRGIDIVQRYRLPTFRVHSDYLSAFLAALRPTNAPAKSSPATIVAIKTRGPDNQ